jgi:hypothetical protein
VLDLPPARHLLDHQFGIHLDCHLVSTQPGRSLQSGYQTPVFGDVVRGPPDGLLALGEHRCAIGREHHRTEPCRTGISPGATIRLDEYLHRLRP